MRRLAGYCSLIFFMLALLMGCVHEPVLVDGGGPVGPGPAGPGPVEEPCDPAIVYFENEVLPLLISNCAKSGCHNSITAEEGIILDSYENVMASDVIRASSARNSDLYEAITEDDREDRMPPAPNQPLTAAQIGVIRKWIDQGAKDTRCESAACDTTSVTFTASIKPIITNKCIGCHSGSAASGGLDFSSHTVLQNVANDGRLIGAITHAAGFTAMPQGGGKLPECDIAKIRIWVENGALNN